MSRFAAYAFVLLVGIGIGWLAHAAVLECVDRGLWELQEDLQK